MPLRHRSTRPPRGAVLLTAVLILASMTAIVGTISTVLYSDLRSNRTIDDGVTAYYRAETGVERALSTIRTYRSSGHCTLATTRCQNDADCGVSGPCVFETFTGTAGAATFNIPPQGIRVTTAGVSRTSLGSIPRDSSVTVNLYDPDNLLGDFYEIRSLKVTGTTTGGFLEVTWSGWRGTGTFVDQTAKYVLSESQLETFPVTINLRSLDSGLVAYQVTLKAVVADVNDVAIVPLNPTGNPVNPPTHFEITSVGTSARSRVALAAVVPWRLAASGLFDFVLFSELTLKKE